MISLFAGEERKVKRERLGDPLQMLDRHIDFAGLAKAVDAKLTIGDVGRGGRPPYATELMIRLLVLQQMYNLSDEAMEYQIIDAGIVSAPIQHNHRDENEALAREEAPADWNAAKRAQNDIEARWTKKHGKSYYGYKLHANTDRRWGFIRRIEVTAASVNDTTVFESILDDTNTNKAVYADRGYAKYARETELHVAGYRACIQRKGTAQRPISEAQQRRNRRIARQRAFGEHPFARLAQMGGKHLRTIGLARAKAVIELKVIAHNLMHLARLQERGIVPA